MGRASILDQSEDETDDIGDLMRFEPKQGPAKDALPPEQVRAIAEASNFPSRDPKPRRDKATAPSAPILPAAPEPAAVQPQRQKRRRRTERTMQFNIRTTPATIDGFYAIADQQGWIMGETIERALAALQRELAAKS